MTKEFYTGPSNQGTVRETAFHRNWRERSVEDREAMERVQSLVTWPLSEERRGLLGLVDKPKTNMNDFPALEQVARTSPDPAARYAAYGLLPEQPQSFSLVIQRLGREQNFQLREVLWKKAFSIDPEQAFREAERSQMIGGG